MEGKEWEEFESEWPLEDWPVDRVTVYRQHAQVTHKLKFDLPAGRGRLSLRAFPSSFLHQQLRIEVGPSVKILKVLPMEEKISRDEDLHQIEELKKKLAGLRVARRKRQAEGKCLREQEELLRRYMSIVQRGSSSLSTASQLQWASLQTLETLERMAIIYETEMGEVHNKQHRIQQQVEEIDQQGQAIEKQINEIEEKTRCADTMWTVVIEVEVEEAGETEMQVSYGMSSASWEPTYDIRIDSKSRKLELVHGGLVKQNSHIPWRDVQITLSTAHPMDALTPPTLPTAHIWKVPGDDDNRFPEIIEQSSEERDSPPGSLGTFPRGEEEERRRQRILSNSDSSPLKSAPTPSTIRKNYTFYPGSFTLTVPHSCTVEEGGKVCKVLVGIVTLQAEMHYTTIPKVLSKAYLQVKTTNQSSYPLLSGPCRLFFDRKFVSTTQLRNIGPMEKMDLFMGVDDDILVQYQKKVYQSERVVQRSKLQTHFHHSITTIRNTKAIPITLAIYDQFPRSQEERVRVKLIEPNPKNTNGLTLLKGNKLEFKYSLGPGEQVLIPIKYGIEHPKDVKLRTPNMENEIGSSP